MKLNADGPYPDYSGEVVDALYEMRAKDPQGGDMCGNAEDFRYLVGWYAIPLVREIVALRKQVQRQSVWRRAFCKCFGHKQERIGNYQWKCNRCGHVESEWIPIKWPP